MEENMKKNHSHQGTLASSQFSLFPKRDDSVNNPRPLYLFCTEEANNKLFLFLSSSKTHCWVKEAKVWNKLEIHDLLTARDGGSKTYGFKRNNYNMDTLNIPYPFNNNASYTSLKEGKTVPLTRISLSEEELDANDITNLEAFDLTGIPETREQVQQQLELAEKKQAIKTEIHKIKVIIGSLQRAFDTILTLDTVQRNSIRLLTDQMSHYVELKEDLDEKYLLLQQPTEAIAEPTISTRFAMQI